MNNRWYAIAQSNNIKKWKIYKLSILDRQFILWRNSEWEININSHICTHMWVCLSKWKNLWDKIECPFHWYTFNWNWKSNKNIPNIKKYIWVEKYWIIWLYNWENILYEIWDFIEKLQNKINLNDYYNISCYTKEYDLQTRLINSNFFDLWHFLKVHWVEIISSNILNDKWFFHYIAKWKYKPYYVFQKFLFKMIPNQVENEIIYKKNFIFSRHSILTKSWKKLFEYFWVLPVSPIWKDKTLVISNILIKKWFFWFFWKIFWKYILFKATNEEFNMLAWINTNIQNYTKEDELLKKFLNFYDNE